MFNKLGRLFAVLALVSSALIFTASPVAATCFGVPTNEHVYVQKHADNPDVPGTYMIRAQGTLTWRGIDYLGCNWSGSAYLINLDAGDGVHILQLGAMKFGDGTADFVYAYNNGGSMIRWPGSWGPGVGTNYDFKIRKGSLLGTTYGPNDVVFTISNNDCPCEQTFVVPQASWDTRLKKDWWGGERLSTNDDIGPDFGETPMIMRNMVYQTETSALTYRSGMNSGDVINTTSGTPTVHGHITDWIYGGDGLQLETH